jgi:Ser/Thr protein kinase RdoA (MazF antagonist)
MILELLGPIGAGKSAIANALPKALRERGIAASPVRELTRIDRRASLLVWGARFAIGHPRLMWSAVRAVLGAPIPWWHRRLILGLVLGAGSQTQRMRRAARDHVLLVDEGLVHRSVNLFAWYPEPPLDALQRYVDRVPMDGTLVYVDASPTTTRRRTVARGWPKRLVGRSPEEMAAFAANARSVVSQAIDIAERRGATVIRIKNRHSLRRSVNEIADHVVGLVQRSPTGLLSAGVFQPKLPILARPDRAIGRFVLRRGGTGIEPAIVDALLERYGLRAIDRARTLTAPRARGSVLLVPTQQGDVVVKRYKDGVDHSAVEIEHAVLDALAGSGIAAPRLRRTEHAASSQWLDDRCYAVYDYIAGHRHPHELLMASVDRHQLEMIAGRILAMLHLALESTRVPASPRLGFSKRGGRRVRDIEWHTARLRAAPVPRRVRAWMEASLWRLAETFTAHELPLTVVHGDFGPYNLLIRRNDVPVVVDFELARLDWRLVDVATALPRFAQRRRHFDVGAARRVLDAYREGIGASEAEIQLLPEMLAFLSLQRAAVAWERGGDADSAHSGAEARSRTVLAEQLLLGQHPLNDVVRLR